MAHKNRTNVGVIGLGIIGSRVAASLRGSGFQAYVWNRTPKAQPNFLGSPSEVAESAEILQLFVADAQATFDVIAALAPKLTPQHVVLCHGTIGLDATLEAARRVGQAGAQFLDAPFTGSKIAAEKKQLVYYTGGSEDTAARVRPVLDASAKAVIHIGGIGQAAVVKIATNLISAATAQVLAEALALTRKAGIPAEALVSAIENNAMRSGVTDLKLPKMISGDYEPHFSLKHMSKDVQLGLALAGKLGLDLPTVDHIGGRLLAGIERGWGEMDYAAVAKFSEAGK